MDDDNVAHPEEIETLVSVSRRTGAEVVWCFQNLFEGDDVPNLDEAEARVEFFPVGPFPAVGPVWNTSGDVNALFLRKTFLDIGGYVERTGVGCEDYEIGLEVALRDIPWAVVPRPLYGYRFSEAQMAKKLNNLSLYLSHRRILDPYVRMLPGRLADVALLYNDLYLAQMQEHGWSYWSRFRAPARSFQHESRKAQPSYTEFLLHLAGNCLEQGDAEAAARYARQVMGERPGDTRPQSLYLEALSRLGASDRLGQALESADISEELRSRYGRARDRAAGGPTRPLLVI
jgi:hypothetical protein